jgi:nucleotide-binding universal stress UspA family protein
MFDKVLLAIDVTHEESWHKALPMALRLVGEIGELHLLGIVHDLGSALLATYLPEGFEKDALEHMKRDLDTFVAEKIPAGVKASVHVGHGHVPQTVISVADAIDADLIVMASHPPDDLGTMLVGSNADKVVRHAASPVLVVR